MEKTTRADVLPRNEPSLLPRPVDLMHHVQIGSFHVPEKSPRSSESRRWERIDPRQRDSIESERANGEESVAESDGMAGNVPGQGHKGAGGSRVSYGQGPDRASHGRKRQTRDRS